MKAFPTVSGQTGMDLRDYFAAKALQAQLGIPEVYDALRRDKLTPESVAGACYEWADHMMKARNETT
jgi:hypothetical protein